VACKVLTPSLLPLWSHPPPPQLDNFRTPNFPLVADVLYWLVLRYEAGAKLSDDIDTESQRVSFLVAAVAIMAAKARLQLKAKALYAADGRAVKELLKVARLLAGCVSAMGLPSPRLHASRLPPPLTPSRRSPNPPCRAVRACGDKAALGEEDDLAGAEAMTFSVKPGELAATRAAASDITARGARLHELLRREEEVGPTRARALRFLDAASGEGSGGGEAEALERAIRSALGSAVDAAASYGAQAADLADDERALSGKLAKKEAELERSLKRLESLSSVRPAFMDEYEKLEGELAEEYDLYVLRFRNLTYLEGEADAHGRREAARAEAAARALARLQRKLKEEEAKLVRGDDGDGDGGDGRPSTSKARGGGSALGARPTGPSAGMGARPTSRTGAPSAGGLANGPTRVPPHASARPVAVAAKGRMVLDQEEDSDLDDDGGGGDGGDDIDDDF